MNNMKQFILLNLRESKAELDAMIAEVEEDGDFDFLDYYVQMQHIYHHLNTAWNIKDEEEHKIEKYSEEDFNKWRKFPDSFDM